MKIAATVILWTVLSAYNAWAEQVCPSGILQTTPTADFTDHGDGTVTHKPTGLMWKQCLEGMSGAGCANGVAGGFTWQQALQHADGHSFAGYGDWRLPNIKELASIVERSCYAPAINLSVFFNDPGLEVWSGSPNADDSGNTRHVYFYYGNDFGRNRDNDWKVRLVRGGQ